VHSPSVHQVVDNIVQHEVKIEVGIGLFSRSMESETYFFQHLALKPMGELECSCHTKRTTRTCILPCQHIGIGTSHFAGICSARQRQFVPVTSRPQTCPVNPHLMYIRCNMYLCIMPVTSATRQLQACQAMGELGRVLHALHAEPMRR
jgi:hypothetical protein